MITGDNALTAAFIG